MSKCLENRQEPSHDSRVCQRGCKTQSRHMPPIVPPPVCPVTPSESQHKLTITAYVLHGHKLDCRAHTRHHSSSARPQGNCMPSMCPWLLEKRPSCPLEQPHTSHENKEPVHRNQGWEVTCSAFVPASLPSASSRKTVPSRHQASVQIQPQLSSESRETRERRRKGEGRKGEKGRVNITLSTPKTEEGLLLAFACFILTQGWAFH